MAATSINPVAGAPYPWLAEAWQRLMRYRREQRLPQAVLLVGRDGLGKRRLAESFAALLLCQQPMGEAACGQCAGCRLRVAETHPDYLVAQPSERGKAIGIDTVRALIDKLALKPQYSGHRVVLLDPAHALNSAAANALLKTLEEPPERTLMLLSSSMPSHIPATLTSRCQRLAVNAPRRGVLLDWLGTQQSGVAAEIALAAACGSPLRAMEMAGNGALEQREKVFDLWPDFQQDRTEPSHAAEKLANIPLETLIDWLYSWCWDVLRLTQSLTKELVNGDRTEQLRLAAAQLNAGRIGGFADDLQRCKRLITTNPQLNRQLLLEEVLIGWWRLARQPG